MYQEDETIKEIERRSQLTVEEAQAEDTAQANEEAEAEAQGITMQDALATETVNQLLHSLALQDTPLYDTLLAKHGIESKRTQELDVAEIDSIIALMDSVDTDVASAIRNVALATYSDVIL